MSKRLTALVAVVLILAAGCGPKEDLGPQEVLEKSVKAMDKLDRFAVSTQVKLEQDLSPQTNQTLIEFDAEVMLNPLTMHQLRIIRQEAENKMSKSEMYVSEEGMFMYEPDLDQWLTLPRDMFEQMMEMEDIHTNPGEHLEDLSTMTDDFHFMEDDSGYRIELSTTEKKFQSFLIELIPHEWLEPVKGEETAKHIALKRITFGIEIDKDTFRQTSLDIYADFSINMDEQTIPVQQTIHTVYRAFNDVPDITIPDEVIENAEDFFGDDIELNDLEQIDEMNAEERENSADQ